jgi:GTPase SAR1 family protein
MQDFFYNQLKAKVQTLEQRCWPLLGQDFLQQHSIDTHEQLPPLKIAFVGQYSAGKSSLIKMLTGIDEIRVGSGVTTVESSAYVYQGLHVVDTPGIRAGHCESHDAKAMQAMAEADLLVFVITNELFDDVLGAYFRRLCFDQQRQKELLIVINKTQNDPGDDQTKLAAICPVLDPLIPENFPIVFTDAQSFFDAQEEDDEIEREELLVLSNRQALVLAIDRFAEARGIYARISTPLQRLQQQLQDRLDELTPASPLEKALVALMRQGRRLFVDSRRSLSRSATALLDDLHGKIIQQGNVLADAVGSGEQGEFERLHAATSQQCQRLVEATAHALAETLEQHVQDLEKDLQELAKTPLGEKVMQAMAQASGPEAGPVNTPSATGPEGVWSLNAELGRSLASEVEKGLAFVVKSAVGDASKTGLKAVSGSSLHEAVKKVGEFIGYKFKAWEAIKIADTLGKGAKFLGPVMAVAGVGLQLLDDHQQSKMRKQVLDAKRSIRREFLEFAHAICQQFKAEETKYFEAAYDKPIAAIDEALEEMQQQAQYKTEQIQGFVECLEEIGSLRREIMDLIPT